MTLVVIELNNGSCRKYAKRMQNERMKDMRKLVIMIVMGVALIALPTMAQQQEWQSTSAMKGSGSSYTPQVTAVGATAVSGSATTTESYSSAKAPTGPRRSKELNDEMEDNDEGSPIGDAVLPLILCALAFGGYIAIRRKKHAEA